MSAQLSTDKGDLPTDVKTQISLPLFQPGLAHISTAPQRHSFWRVQDKEKVEPPRALVEVTV